MLQSEGIRIVFLMVIVYNMSAGRDTLYTHDIELTFKRYVRSSIMGSPLGDFFVFTDMGLNYEYICLFR